MWLMTTHGFFSVVQHNKKEHLFIIRARKREHLANLKKAFRNKLSKVKIYRSREADYEFRIFLHRDVALYVFARLIAAIDYANFKNEVKAVRGPGEYTDFLTSVWWEGLQMQLPKIIQERYYDEFGTVSGNGGPLKINHPESRADGPGTFDRWDKQ